MEKLYRAVNEALSSSTGKKYRMDGAHPATFDLYLNWQLSTEHQHALHQRTRRIVIFATGLRQSRLAVTRLPIP